MASKNGTKVVKAQELETKEDIKQSRIDRYLPLIQKAQANLSKANVEKLKASVEIGKALIELRTVFSAKEFETWADATVGLKRAQVYNMMKLADPKHKKELAEAITEKLGPTDTLKKMREATAGDGKPKGKAKSDVAFEYGIKRNTTEVAKPGEGNAEEIANQLYEAIDSILESRKDIAEEIREFLLQNLEDHIVTNEEVAEAK